MNHGREDGFTIIELLVAILILSLVSVGFYSVLFSGSRGGDTTRSVVRVSEEARGGLNRMIRDTREADVLVSANPTSYRIRIDFNGDGVFQNPTAAGDYEDVLFRLVGDEIRITAGTAEEVLVDGVTPIPGKDVFSYTSNRLDYDWNGDGITTWQEIDEASSPAHGQAGVGNNNGIFDSGEYSLIAQVVYSMRISNGDSTTDFYSQAQLRNRR